jgi:hypothetical protein
MEDQRVNIVLPNGLKTEAKIKCAKEHVSLSALLRAFLEDWVSGKLETPERLRKIEKKG